MNDMNHQPTSHAASTPHRAHSPPFRDIRSSDKPFGGLTVALLRGMSDSRDNHSGTESSLFTFSRATAALSEGTGRDRERFRRSNRLRRRVRCDSDDGRKSNSTGMSPLPSSPALSNTETLPFRLLSLSTEQMSNFFTLPPCLARRRLSHFASLSLNADVSPFTCMRACHKHRSLPDVVFL
ncbi:hypothetical protein BC826DRAFT_1007352 [Russula brevipes]|nr:hypothetical protein BC826DRAFT_1007352 [Russula brevipes]